MNLSRMINVVGVHAAGAYNEVIVGGVRNVPGKGMFEKMKYVQNNEDNIRKLILNEPRGRAAKCVNLVLPATDPRADAGFIIIESDYYVPMSGTNTISTVTALLETGIIPMLEPVTELTLEVPAGLIKVVAQCRGGKCLNVTFDNVPAFVFGLDQIIDVPGLGKITVDVAYGGMIYCLVDARTAGFQLELREAAQLVEVGERIKAAAAEQIPVAHPENSEIHTVNQTLFYGPLEHDGKGLVSKNTVIVSPGRHDRSPCGTGTSARMAVLYEKGQLGIGERFLHRSLLGTEFVGYLRATVQLSGKLAVLPTITGSAWITGFHQYVLDPTDPFPEGYRIGDSWPGLDGDRQ